MKNNEILWVIWEWVDIRDHIEEFIWNSEEDFKLEVKFFSNIKYNQKLVDRYSCTSAAAIWVISDVTWFALPKSFREQVWENQLKTWAKKGFWDTIQNWMKQSVKLFNKEFPELPYFLEYKRLDDVRDVKKIFDVLKVSSISTWYRWSLRKDAEDNWVIDNPDNKDWAGHCIRIVKAWLEWTELCIKYVDNYEWENKYNVITVPDFKNNKDFYKGGYYLRKVYK